MYADIILPVYNAFEYTCRCVESVRRFTELSEKGDRLFVINDCSTDERLAPFLQSLEGQNGIVVLTNEKNLGFVGTVNRGMRLSKNDVVLLNSDTEVTENWLKKLKACAASDERIATVTPFTNNGTICSLPRFCEDNPLPEVGLAECARLVERASIRTYPGLPTAVGFCMLITRRSLNAVGFFDETAFGKGYGEENDFCYRAQRAGFQHRLCDDLFVLHKGTMSFDETRHNANMERNTAELNRRYPRERRQTLEFIRQNPLYVFQKAAELQLICHSGRLNILYILHMPVPYRPGDSQAGGTQKHVLELARALSKSCNAFILWPEKGRGYCLLALCGGEPFEMFFSFGALPGESESEKLGGLLRQVKNAFGIGLVHIHHTMWLPDDLFDLAHGLGLPLVFTAHDYFLLCPYVNMTHPGGYCGADFSRCAACAGEQDAPLVTGRLERARHALSLCDAVLAPDGSVAEIFSCAVSGVKFRIIEHGIDPSVYLPVKDGHEPAAEDGKGVFNIAYIGAVNGLKGGGLLGKIVGAARGDRALRFHVFGAVEDRRLGEKLTGVVLHGRYQSRELPRLLSENGIDLVLLLSRWPETYNYVLSECFLAGVPVLASDVGAFGARLRESGFGRLVPFDASPAAILREIRSLRDDAEGLRAMQKALAGYTPFTLDEMAQSYLALYRSLAGPQKDGAFDTELILGALRTASAGTKTMGLSQANSRTRLIQLAGRFLPKRAVDFLVTGDYPLKRELMRAASLLLSHRHG